MFYLVHCAGHGAKDLDADTVEKEEETEAAQGNGKIDPGVETGLSEGLTSNLQDSPVQDTALTPELDEEELAQNVADSADCDDSVEDQTETAGEANGEKSERLKGG